MKSKNKRGRPRTNRKPVLVRFDKEALQIIDRWMRSEKLATRPETIRRMVKTLDFYWPAS